MAPSKERGDAWMICRNHPALIVRERFPVSAICLPVAEPLLEDRMTAELILPNVNVEEQSVRSPHASPYSDAGSLSAM